MRRHVILFGLLLAACAEREVPNAPQGLGIADVLGGAENATGFARATEPPQLQFPRDHGAHPAFRTEWWYVTGNLDAADGHRFGVQLVFFRQALAPAGVPREAAMAAREMVLAHAAVTDVDGDLFHAEERLERLAAGLAEVRGPTEGEPFHIVCAEWSARAAQGGDGFLPLDLHASGREFSFALRVEPGKPLVLQGDRGLSQKSEAPGNASIYYSMTRLPIAGTITSQGAQHEVHGECWIDREWSTSALGPQQVGWDWFSLQLDSGEELMWYRLRRRDGSIDPWSRGSLVDVAGNSATLLPAQVQTIPAGSWSAPDGGATYPATWRLVGTSPDFDLVITPLLANQELHTLVRYWEGAVAVRGTRNGKSVTGRGYLEMTGYAHTK